MALAPVGIAFVSSGTSNLIRDLENVRKQLGLYGDTAEKVGNQTKGASGGVRSMNRAISGTSASASSSQRSVSALSNTFGELNNAISAPSRAVGQFGEQVGRLGFRIGDIGRRLTQAGAGITAFVTVPVVLGLGKATQSALAFEKELIKLNTQIGLNSTEVLKFNDAILGIGRESIAIETATSAAELAGGSFVIASAGIRDSEEALTLLTQSAKAAQLGLGDTADIARAAAGAMQAFGITGTEAVDILLATVREGNLVATDLAGTLGRFSGIAELLGVEFADASAFIATFTRSGASAAEAATSLRGVLSTFAKPTQQTVDALSALGFPIEEVQKAIADPSVGLNATLVELARRVDETGGDVGVGLAQIFGNVRALAGVAFVTGIPEELEAINQSIRNSAGVVDEGFNTIRQTAGFQIEQFKATVEVLAITIGNVLLPILSAAIQRILPFVEAIRAFTAENPRLIQVASIFALIAAAIGPIIVAMGTFTLAVGGIVGAIGGLITALGALISPIGLVFTAVVGLAAAIGGPLLLGFAEVSGFFDQSLGDIASNAFAWGRNIVVQFAKGMIAGAIAVIDALNQIGRAITNWLAPGSPPRLLPDIDKWGTAAMNEFIHGFELADFDTFDAIAGITEKVIRSGVDKVTEGTLDTIRDFRERIAGAVTSSDSIGSNFDSIAESIGFANRDLTVYASTMLRLQEVTEQVARAQKEIEQINSNFENTIAPLNAELDAIEARRDEVRRAQRTEELQSIIDDASAPALAKELAQLELREFQINDQLKAEEALKDEALTAAEAKLAALEAEQQALEDQAELQLRVIEAQLQENELLKEQKDAIEELANSISNLGDSLSSIGGGVGDIGFGDGGLLGDADPFNFSDIIGEGVQEATDEIVGQFDQLKLDLLALLQPLIDKFNELKDTWADVVSTFLTVGDDLVDTETTLDGLVEAVEGFFAGIADNTPAIEEDIGSITTSFENLGQAVEDAIGGVTDVLFADLNVGGGDSVIGQILAGLGQLIGFVLEGFTGVWSLFIFLLLAPFTAFLEQLPSITDNILEIFGGWIDQWNAILEGDWSGFLESLGRIKDGAFGLVQDIVLVFANWFDELLSLFGTSLSEIGTTFSNWLVEQLINFGNWVNNTVAQVDRWDRIIQIRFRQWAADTRLAIVTWINDVIEQFTTWKDDLIQTFTDWKDGVSEQITTFFDEAIENAEQWVKDIIDILGDPEALIQAGKDFLDGFQAGILAKAQSIFSTLRNVVSDAVQVVTDALQSNSPSRVMMRLGEFAGEGLALGIASTRNLVSNAASSIGNVIAPAVVQAQPVVSNSATINMGGVSINNGMDEIIFESRVRRILTQALGETL